MRLEGKIALISGGARGMGAVEARLFAKEGAKVVLGDILEVEGRRVESEIRTTGGEAIFVRLDVTSESDWRQAVDTAVARFGNLNVLVNNAGVSGGHARIEEVTVEAWNRVMNINATGVFLGSRAGRLEETTVEAWDHVMDVNAKGVFLGTKTAIPALRRAGGGSIVNISSQLGLVGVDTSSPQYQASKGAVRLLTKATAIQYAKEGIRANSVHPGPIVTPMTEAGRAHPESYRLTVSRVPLGRYGEPEDVAYGVLYLASDESSFVTGAELVIDGGWTAQ